MLHLCCQSEKDYPAVSGNTYVQILGLPLGQFGAAAAGAPPALAFLETSDREIAEMVGDREAVARYTVQKIG